MRIKIKFSVFPAEKVLVKVVKERPTMVVKLDVTTIVVNTDALLIFIFTPDGSMFSFPTRVFYFVNA